MVGVTGVIAGVGSGERIGSLSGLSKETSSVASKRSYELVIITAEAHVHQTVALPAISCIIIYSCFKTAN